MGEIISPKQFFHHLLRMREEIFSELVMLGFLIRGDICLLYTSFVHRVEVESEDAELTWKNMGLIT